MFRVITKISILSLALTCQSFAYASNEKSSNINLAVKLDSIKRVKAQEDQGDELYFAVTEYSSTQDSDHYQVPSFPTHWLSSHLEQVKDVSLWQRQLKDSESVELIISLVERDVPPWNVDDLVGSLKLKIRWKDNQLSKEWSIPNQSNTKRIPDKKDSFKLIGDDSHYTIQLSLDELDEKPEPISDNGDAFFYPDGGL